MACDQGSCSRIAMEKCIIVAVASNNAIGVNGTMAWHISEDFRYFKRVTMGCPVIMGRTTYESIGRPLPGRTNIILSRKDLDIPGTVCVHSMDEAYRAAGDAERCFVLGGASVYKEVMNEVDKLYVTHIFKDFPEADAYFPEIDSYIWRIESESQEMTDDKSGLKFKFVVYSKVDG